MVPTTSLWSTEYQRTQVRRHRVMYLVNNWDWRLYMPIKIAARKNEEGKYRIIDGQHRWLAAKILEIEELPAIMTESNGISEEAGLCRKMNGKTGAQPFTQFDDWKTALVEGDPEITALNEVIERNGFVISHKANDYHITAIAEIKSLAEAKGGKINVIVIKDTSRFGRNWVLSGDYFTRIEEMGIRFISIQEGIDTIDPKCPALKMMPFYFVFNEWHSQTTSEKIRTVFANNAEQGKFWASIPPYGYERDPQDRHRLVIDPYAGSVVRRIFAMRLQKNSYHAIAAVLNNEGVLAPRAYVAEKHGKKSTHVGRMWAAVTLVRLVNNPVYCGDIVHGRFGVVSYKNRKRVNHPEENWITVRDMHEPLVSREDWLTCADMQDNLGRVRRTKDVVTAPFSGLLVCADCGYKMQRRCRNYSTKKSGELKDITSYVCTSYAKKGKIACSTHYILERDLEEWVLADIRKKAVTVLHDEAAARELYFTHMSKISGSRITADKNSLKKIEKRITELDTLLQADFERSVFGGESSDVFTGFTRKYEAEKQELLMRSRELSAAIEAQSRTESDVDTFIGLMKEYVNITRLDRATAALLIDHIEISAFSVVPREIVIHYNLIGNA